MNRIILALYILTSLRAIFSILLHGNRPSRSVSWVFTVIVLPFAGALLYYFFGVNRRKFKLFTLKHTKKRKLYDTKYHEITDCTFAETEPTGEFAQVSKLIINSGHTVPYSGNSVQVLNNGDETFNAIFEALENARKFIHLQYYIFENGTLQEKFYEILKRKIKEGIEVRLIYDSLGSFSFRGRTMKRFREIGVEAYPILPIRLGNLLYTLNYRNHRKILIVDGDKGFVGGVNISDKYLFPISELGIWQDIHIYFEGPTVGSLHRIFIKDFHFASSKEPLLNSKYLVEPEKRGNCKVQIVTSGPDSDQPTIMQQYICMINTATKKICIANPYFIPNISILDALKIAALKGVEVNLLVPENSDSKLAKYSMFSRFEELLRAGVHIYLRKDFAHSKLIMIDDKLVSIGSGNFDHRSFEHNFESNALIFEETIANEIGKKFAEISERAQKLDYGTFKKRPLWKKLIEGFAKFFSPLL